ncbi:MAG: CAP domain-containing protein [Muricauda sp.]|jgi:uncharacterized protein YkwD|nr:CAP domain-containing protein [Allomuricauda sp.]MBO6532180.1 CAP domain-containing protein [Allomuricauda sp.]MBO6587854.1 CAP domain-containing protein [Allomuricauda sp.]MBO6617479.1 CAP domain-containing protein [Allomuricauda sp.]MBO6643510.1 CAP domain-containing protein [Allomuricauda sp.]MBO6745814.1 CAP domain-containing protein [Allomuricauda sp.]
MKKCTSTLLIVGLVLLLAGCSKSSTEELEQLYTEASIGNDKVSVDPIKTEEELLDLVNEYRNSIGLEALITSEPAYKYAEDHNNYMISKNSLSHDNFEERAASIAAETNAQKISENVARFYASAEKTMDAWVASASHKQALDGDFTHTALSVQLDKDGRPYYTQIFIKID